MTPYTRQQITLVCETPLEVLRAAVAGVTGEGTVYLGQMSDTQGRSGAFWLIADGKRVLDAEVHEIAGEVHFAVTPGAEGLVGRAMDAMIAAAQAQAPAPADDAPMLG